MERIADDVKILSMAMEKYIVEGQDKLSTVQEMKTEIVELRREVQSLKHLINVMGTVLMQTKTEMEEVKHNTENDSHLHGWMYEESFQDANDAAVTPKEIIRGAESRKELADALKASRNRDDQILKFTKRGL